MIDLTPRPRPPRKERSGIILGGGWSDDPNDDGRRQAGESMGFWSREGSKPFGHRSPLARKIITFNLVALGVLVAGVLYLNQFQDGLISMRERSLVAESQMIAQAISSNWSETDTKSENEARAVETLDSLGANTAARAQLFDADGGLLADTFFLQRGGDAPAPTQITPEDGPRTSAMTNIMNEVWTRFARLYQRVEEAEDAPSSLFSNEQALTAIETGEVTPERRNNRAGQILFSVAAPITSGDAVTGAVVLTTQGGELDTIVRTEREQILQVFALAMISSIALSLVLANTIARPIRKLAEAAEKGGATSSRRLNPERIRIPDMTARPDEIGYLSGAMRMMTAALYDRIEANEVFAADVAHEIKNPLTSLRSAVETMRYAKTEENREKLLKVIEQDVNRLDRLVTDISNASRLDSELVRDEMVPFDLGKMLGNLVEYNIPNAEKVGGHLQADLPDTPLMISGLEGRLAQVFVNLITNAISFTTEGGVVTVSARRGTNGLVRVMVEDTGPGIPEDNLKDVFSRFYSERPDQEFGNHSGLGLAISKQIVEAHGGQIWAQNVRDADADPDSPPQGARFVVELPD
ncbi:stimulus-sensing domain-containing protein [Oceanomicrobium pacificus]|uniref:histidine kinase n=1 Tax=Oceanomicrobium pacificus TaxID=2692916 RepID=A0A6B0TJ92_9RHOB|nr:stimulus-sensing domain-containing protein [Oceanomicrobium pacificus]MXU63946.1 histidine kinase [Oceanomicrobium pacificus]